jgi:hypothetical protein
MKQQTLPKLMEKAEQPNSQILQNNLVLALRRAKMKV